MLISEMEAVLKSLDQRVGRIEQILPTLATKADLEATAAELRNELRNVRNELRDEFRGEIRGEVRGVKVLIEDVRGDVRLLAEHLSTLMNQMSDVLQRLERR